MRISTSTLTILALSFATSANAASLKSSAGTSHKDKNELIPLQNAGRKLSRAATSAISAFQKSSIPEPRFLETDPDATCMADTIQLGDGNTNPFDVMGEDTISEENCNIETLTCDLSSSKDAAKAECDDIGGKIVTNDILLCEEDMMDPSDPADSGIGGDVLLKNVQICLASSCDNDTKLPDMFSSYIEALTEAMELLLGGDAAADMMDEITDEMPKAFKGEQCNSGASSGAGVAKTFGPFILASVAGAVALFTV